MRHQYHMLPPTNKRRFLFEIRSCVVSLGKCVCAFSVVRILSRTPTEQYQIKQSRPHDLQRRSGKVSDVAGRCVNVMYSCILMISDCGAGERV